MIVVHLIYCKITVKHVIIEVLSNEMNMDINFENKEKNLKKNSGERKNWRSSPTHNVIMSCQENFFFLKYYIYSLDLFARKYHVSCRSWNSPSRKNGTILLKRAASSGSVQLERIRIWCHACTFDSQSLAAAEKIN